MRRLAVIAAIAAAGLGLAACGGDTTTVVNNTTTVTEAPDSATTADTSTTAEVDDGYCGPASPDGVGIYDVATAGIDCKTGQKLAQQWWDFGCITAPSNTCRFGDMVCDRKRQGSLETVVNCKAEDTSVDQELRFVFASDV